MLKITAPFREKSEVMPLIEAGTDELYCGYLPGEWKREFTDLEFERKGRGCNFTDLKKLSEAVDLAHEKNIPVFLTLNGLYVKEQYPLLLKIIKDLEKTALDAYIVADIGLILTLRRMKTSKEIHISTGGTVFNSESTDFYKDLGASRVILDRQVTLDAIKALSESHPSIDFEVFILNTLCVFIDGFCTFLHTYGRDSIERVDSGGGDEKTVIMTAYDPAAQGDACSLEYSVETCELSIGEKKTGSSVSPTFFKRRLDGTECGACALYDISRTKTKSVKIVGRQLSSQSRLRGTRFIRRSLDILEGDKGISRAGYMKEVQRFYRETFDYKGVCRGNNCYHPSVLNRLEQESAKAVSAQK